MNENSKPVQYIEEDTIDLGELWKTLMKRKVLILSVTVIVTLLAITYTLLIKPIYEVKSYVELAYIDGKPLKSTEHIREKLNVVFHVTEPLQGETSVVSSVSTVKKVDNMLLVKTRALSNEEAVAKAEEVVAYMKSENLNEIEEYIDKNKKQIEVFSRQLKRIEDVDIKKIDEKISFLKTQKLKSIELKIAKTESEKEKYISLIKVLQSRLESSKEMAFNTMTMLQISNYQNLQYNLDIKQTDLVLSKENIILEAIPDLERQKTDLLNITLPKFNDDIAVLKYNISPSNLKNASVVGEMQVSDYPVKPKKKLIVIVAFVTGLMFSIFLAFFLEFVKGGQREEDQEKQI